MDIITMSDEWRSVRTLAESPFGAAVLPAGLAMRAMPEWLFCEGIPAADLVSKAPAEASAEGWMLAYAKGAVGQGCGSDDFETGWQSEW
jgi:hypothetical protein